MLQGGEILIILLVALVVLGPTRLPDLARKAGGYATELRKAAREIRQGLESEVSDLKSASDELKAMNQEIRKPFDDVKRGIDEVGVSRLDWTGPKPISGPTPADAMADYEEIQRQEAEAASSDSAKAEPSVESEKPEDKVDE